MSFPVRGWPLAAMIALALAVFPVSRAVGQDGWQTLSPKQLPATVQLFNSLSGPIASLSQSPASLQLVPPSPAYNDPAPLSGIPVDEYGRLSWHSLEPAEGQYDFSVIAQALRPCALTSPGTLCLPAGAAFGFRVMALNPIVKLDTNVSTGADGYPVYSDLPAYLETSAHGWLLPVDPTDPTLGHYFIPDWNDPFFLSRIQALLAALGQQLDGRSDIGWVDIGLYGSWGEWHTGGLQSAEYHGIPYTPSSPYYAINTEAYLANTGRQGAYQAGSTNSKNFIIDAHEAAFPNTRLLMLTDDGEGLCHALSLPGSATHIGLTRDSFGSSAWTYQFPTALPDCNTAADQALILNRWKTAPFGAEPYGNGSSPVFPCQTFETDPGTGVYLINEEVSGFHIADIRNASACTGTWADLTASEQQAFSAALAQSGYRLAPVQVSILPFLTAFPPRIDIGTVWANSGVTPAYDDWIVAYSLWTPARQTARSRQVAQFQSRLDLRSVLPTSGKPIAVHESFPLPDNVGNGTYVLKIRVTDPKNYRLPMQLALEKVDSDGYYTIGTVTISGHTFR